MPLVTITTTEAFSGGEQTAIADAVQHALAAAGFPERDRFQKILTNSGARLIYDRHHPDLEEARSDRFVLVEITISKGRDTAFKKALVTHIVERVVKAAGNDPRDVMVLITETERENWAFHSGIQYYVETAQ